MRQESATDSRGSLIWDDLGVANGGRSPSIDVAEILAARGEEAAALHEKHLNRQMVRVLRAIGFDRTWVRGEGAHLIDAKGDRYLDLLSGYGVFALGRNPEAVREQLERVLAASTPSLPQLGVTVLPGVLAEELLRRAPASLATVLLTNSGAESVEGAIKMARAATARPRILHCDHAFHGLTMGALSVNGNEEFRERFGPFLPGCDSIPFGDLDALRPELARGDVAAFIVEPVQGKGVRLPPRDYLPEAQELCRRHGTLLCVDEVQTGLGRTGRFLALEHWGLEPDMVLLSKALSGGYVPVGAILASREVFDRVFDSMERSVAHGSTFGQNDLAAAAALATLAEIDDAGLVDRARALGGRLLDLTRPLAARHEVVREVRGLGLMWAIELGSPAGGAARRTWEFVERRQPGLASQLVVVPLFRDHRILTQVAGHRMNVVKALPPLVIDEADLERFAAALDQVIGGFESMGRSMARLTLGMAMRSLRRAPSPTGSAPPAETA
jgi:ornithine--oxo-acid transaminase